MRPRRVDLSPSRCRHRTGPSPCRRMPAPLQGARTARPRRAGCRAKRRGRRETPPSTQLSSHGSPSAETPDRAPRPLRTRRQDDGGVGETSNGPLCCCASALRTRWARVNRTFAGASFAAALAGSGRTPMTRGPTLPSVAPIRLRGRALSPGRSNLVEADVDRGIEGAAELGQLSRLSAMSTTKSGTGISAPPAQSLIASKNSVLRAYTA